MKRLFGYSYFFVAIALFFYSFTQVDLSLTLSRVSIYQTVEKYFQHIGYFNRPESTVIFIALLILMFSYYLYFLRQAYAKKIKIKQIWILIIGTAAILALSYNAFSYDLFNYIFDAKIITHYHQNPYFHKALMNAYDRLLAPEMFPAYFIFLEINPENIDVNIHPTKTEIKFEDEQSIWQIIHATAKEALGKFNVVPSIDFNTEPSIEIPVFKAGVFKICFCPPGCPARSIIRRF